MRPPPFDVAELRAFVARRLGTEATVFELVTVCSRPENFRLVTGAGERFLVKCVPDGDKYFHTHLLSHLQDLRDVPEVIHLVHGPWRFHSFSVVLLSWCAGARVTPDRLTVRQESELVRTYAAFSAAVQKVRVRLPPRDFRSAREKTLARLDCFGCRSLAAFVRKLISSDSVTYDSSRLRVIHGDFHQGNFHFDGDAVSAIMDLEELRLGYTAEDWVRYVICAAEHLPWFDFAGRRRIAEFFRRLLPLAPSDEWMLAVNSFLVRKMYVRFSKKANRLRRIWWARKLGFRLLFYRRLTEAVQDYGAIKTCRPTCP